MEKSRHRQKYKQGLDGESSVRAQATAEQLRKSERDRSFAAKRQQIIRNAAAGDAAREELDRFQNYTDEQIRNSVGAVSAAAASLLAARCGTAAPPSTADNAGGLIANWLSTRSALPPLADTILAGGNVQGVEMLKHAAEVVGLLRKILSTLSPPVTEVVHCGALEVLVVSFNICCGLVMNSGRPVGQPVDVICERLLQDVILSLANIWGADTDDHSALMTQMFPTVGALFELAVDNMAACAGPPHNSVRLNVQLNEPAHTTEALTALLGNMAADRPKLVLESGDVDGPVEFRPPRTELCPLLTLRTAVRLFNILLDRLTPRTDLPQQQPPRLLADQQLLHFSHTVTWLISNLSALRDPSVVCPLLLPPTYTRQTAEGEPPTSGQLNAFAPLAKVMEWAAAPSAPQPSAASPVVAMGVPEKPVAAVVLLPVECDLRRMVGEGLWSIACCCTAEPRIFRDLFAANLVDAAGCAEPAKFITALVDILISAQLSQASVSPSPLPIRSSSSEGGSPLNASPTSTSGGTPRGAYGVDLVMPALQILSFVASSSVVRVPGDVASPGADILLAIPQTGFLISQFLSHRHRGVTKCTAELLAVLASAQPQHTKFVLKFLPNISQIIHGSAAFDLKREAAAAMVHLALNHGNAHLDEVLAVEPSVVDGILKMFSTCKFDKVSLVIALDFLEGYMRCRPEGVRSLYEKDAIEIIESVQQLHDEELFHRISDVVAGYFDGLDNLEEVG